MANAYSQSEVEVVRVGERMVLRFPARELGHLSQWGWAPLAVGSFGILFMTFWMAQPTIWGIRMILQGQWMGLVSIAFGMCGLVGMFFAIKTFAFGLAVIQNRTRSEIELNSKALISRERFGWFSLKSRWKINSIERFELTRQASMRDAADAEKVNQWLESRLPAHWYALRVISSESAKTFSVIAIAYPRDLVIDAARNISEELERVSDQRPIDGAYFSKDDSLFLGESNVDQKISTKTLFDPSSLEEQVDTPERPSKTSVTIHRSLDGPLVFQIPATGLTGTARWLFGFSCFWNLFMIVFTGIWISANAQQPMAVLELTGLIAFLLVFWIVGISMLVYAICLSRRSTMIGIEQPLCFYETKGLFKTQWREFETEHIQDVRVGPSGMTINEVPVNELQIVVNKPAASTFGLLSNLTDEELRWIAYELRNELSLTVQSKSD